MKRMSDSKPIFLRCIKPNSNKESDNFDSKFVLLQLRYCGILETTRIRKEGYSLRLSYQKFIDRYKYLSPDNKTNEISSETCIKILNNTDLKDWRVGKSKVFLKYYHYDELKSNLNVYINAAIIIQKCKNIYIILSRKIK
jgi:myosin III